MSIKSHILFSIFSIATLIAAGGIAGAIALTIAFAAVTIFLVHMAATTLSWLRRPLAPVYCRHKTRVCGRSPW